MAGPWPTAVEASASRTGNDAAQMFRMGSPFLTGQGLIIQIFKRVPGAAYEEVATARVQRKPTNRGLSRPGFSAIILSLVGVPEPRLGSGGRNRDIVRRDE